jgi:thermolysin
VHIVKLAQPYRIRRGSILARLRLTFRARAWVAVLGLASLAASARAVRWEPETAGVRRSLAAAAVPVQVRIPSAGQVQRTREAVAAGAVVEWNTELGTPALIRGRDLRPPAAVAGGSRSAGSPEQDARLVLEQVAGLLGAREPAVEFVVRGVTPDELGFRHVRVDQRHRGLRVVGGQLMVHFNAAGEAYQVNGRYVADLAVDDAPVLSADEALAAARAHLESAGRTDLALAAGPELTVLAYHTAPALAYEVILACREPSGREGRWRLWLAASDGRVLLAADEIRRVAPPSDNGYPALVTGNMLAGEGGLVTNIPAWYENAGRYYLYNTSQCWYVFNIGGAGYVDNNTYAFRTVSDWGVSDRTEISAANNFRHTQNYFRAQHSRASYDDANMLARANVHYGQNYVNAFWDGTSFNFGDGNGVEANSLAVLDVAAHEFGHAVTEFTADLFYYGESGAINESYSDIWAASVEFYAQPDGRAHYPNAVAGTADWLIGEDCWLNGTALRDMRNPGSTVTLAHGNQQPSRYKGTNWWNTADAEDNGGVHQNSGVQNFMFYLLAEGGSGMNDGIAYSVTGIGITNAARVAYRALTAYFTKYTDLSEARRCWSSAAADLNAAWVPSVEAAWAAVGVAGDQLSASLGDAVNAPHLPWYTGGAISNNWFAQSVETYDGVLAAQSGKVSHQQDTRILTTVRGPGRVSFFWKVSSEGNYDWLVFYLDNELRNAISGNQNWHQITSEVPAGVHTLKWVYQKDQSASSGSDAGWLDLLVWTPFAAQTPTGFTASDGTTPAGVQLTWQAAPYADWYEVWRGPNSDSAFASRIGQSSTVGYLDASIAPLSVAYYWVAGANPNGTSTLSACDFGYRALPAPAGVAATAGTLSDAIQVSWQAVSNASAYEVWRSSSSSLGTAVPLNTNLTALSYRDTTAVPGLAYYYWVRARGFVVPALANIGAFSAAVSGWRFIPPPTDVHASDGTFTDKVRITWSPVSGAVSYEVWRSLSSDVGSALKISASNPTSPTFDDPSTLIGVTYYYWVKAVAPVGTSGFSQPDSGWRTSPTVPPAPTNVVASDGTYSNKVRVTWSRVSVANSYEIWRATRNDASAAVWMENTAGTRYDDFAVTVGVPYYYWIKAKGDGGTGGFSEPDSGFAWPGGIPEPTDHVFNDYNGDGVSDLAVYDPATGLWFVTTAQGIILAWNFPWGGPGLVPAPGDYSGDSFTEYSVYGPGAGAWFIRTGAGTQLAWNLTWGGGGLVSVYGDYNGDGLSDLAVYDPVSGAWYIRTLAGSTLVWGTAWGGSGLWPVPGDYDGDGRHDLAVYEPASGRWFVLSMAGYAVVAGDTWGGPGFEAVMGDYNGDMLSDMAVYDRNAGAWYIRTVYGSYLAWGLSWGGAGLVPGAGDFNGDGRADLAVCDALTGHWYIRTLGGVVLTWGLPWGGLGFDLVRGAPAAW